MTISFEIEYTNNGEPISDFELEKTYNKLLSLWRYDREDMADETFYLAFSTGNIFNRIRLGIAHDEIPCDNIVFIFENQKIKINRYGMIEEWPKGFLHVEYSQAADLIHASVMKRKREREEGPV